jgi:hypothetical protein
LIVFTVNRDIHVTGICAKNASVPSAADASHRLKPPFSKPNIQDFYELKSNFVFLIFCLITGNNGENAVSV